MTDMRASAEHRAPNLKAYNFRADPHLIQLAKLGLMLPAEASVSEVVRAALALAAGEEAPDGRVSRGGWRPRRGRVYVDRSTMRVRRELCRHGSWNRPRVNARGWSSRHLRRHWRARWGGAG